MRKTWKELGFVLGACALVAITDKMLIIYFGHSFISEIFGR